MLVTTVSLFRPFALSLFVTLLSRARCRSFCRCMAQGRKRQMLARSRCVMLSRDVLFADVRIPVSEIYMKIKIEDRSMGLPVGIEIGNSFVDVSKSFVPCFCHVRRRYSSVGCWLSHLIIRHHVPTNQRSMLINSLGGIIRCDQQIITNATIYGMQSFLV